MFGPLRHRQVLEQRQELIRNLVRFFGNGAYCLGQIVIVDHGAIEMRDSGGGILEHFVPLARALGGTVNLCCVEKELPCCLDEL